MSGSLIAVAIGSGLMIAVVRRRRTAILLFAFQSLALGVGAVAVNGITGFIAETEANFLPLVERLFADDIIRFKMGTSARARIMENFSLPHYVSRIAVHYEMLLGES